MCSLFGDLDVVLPGFLAKRLHPRQFFPVAPHIAGLTLYRKARSCLGKQIVLKDNNPRYQINPLFLQRLYQLPGIPDGDDLLGTDLRGQRYRTLVVYHPPVALDVYHEGV
ncbi:hypothetical protein MBAV_004158 [Candidatus Magnetobacterium bavaricum]|uniref:Uncharacterized protein n=1 Tax=Candidatus Magnetobacterium bavaricum TaxID=29290 RepID=A0A0F3GSH9_9BACT|nr:hypothetical protein MBAV_004158 [Candidatus Magnetobacterium bavaricum]